MWLRVVDKENKHDEHRNITHLGINALKILIIWLKILDRFRFFENESKNLIYHKRNHKSLFSDNKILYYKLLHLSFIMWN